MTTSSQLELSRRHSALRQKYVDADQSRLKTCKSASLAIIQERLRVQVGAVGGIFRSEEMVAEVVV